MLAIGSASTKLGVFFAAVLTVFSGCSRNPSQEPVRSLQIQQSWELQPGDVVAGHVIAGSLGDISIQLNGARVYAPFDGTVQPNDIEGCLVYSSPEVPAYVFRLCGLKSITLGQVQQGDAIGKGAYLEFAALRRQPDGTWALVEPASDILERTLTKP